MAKKSLELKTDVGFHVAESCQALGQILVSFQISNRSLPGLLAPKPLLCPPTALAVTPSLLHWVLGASIHHSL